MSVIADKNFLNLHLQHKLANHLWLRECLEGKTKPFPYRPVLDGQAEILRPFVPSQNPTSQVTQLTRPTPLFVANIPMARLPSAAPGYSSVRALIRLLRNESFETTSKQSAVAVKQRLAVVLGINQIHSIDPELNRAFRRHIRDLPAIETVVWRAIGFFWKPEWKKHLGKATKEVEKQLYSLPKAFLLLKALSAERAKKVRQALEQPEGLSKAVASQIPYRQIRETIKNSRATRAFMGAMEAAAPNAPIYYTVMDADCVRLRPTSEHKGLFSRLTELIIAKENPSIVSLGYSVEDAPLLSLAVEIDMAVRSTMPMPYFPEPCTAFKVRRPGERHFLCALSFMGRVRGRGLESRRFIESGTQKYLTDGAVLQGDGGVVTTTPRRMKTIHNQSVQTLTLDTLKQKPSFQALRGRTLQTHAFPKQWADILYAGLNFSCPRVTDATTPMMHLFSVWDPISRMFDTPRYTSKVFNQIMQNYNKPLSDGQKNLVATAKAKLLALKMEKAMVDLVVKTAQASGKAIYQVLSAAVSDLEQNGLDS